MWHAFNGMIIITCETGKIRYRNKKIKYRLLGNNTASAHSKNKYYYVYRS